MAYNDQLFHKYVEGLKVGDVLFEAAGVQYVKRSDGLWVTGDNVAEDDPIVNVTDYINSLHSIIDAAAECWGWSDNMDCYYAAYSRFLDLAKMKPSA